MDKTMFKSKVKMPRTRVTLDLGPEDLELLHEISSGKDCASMLRKAIRLMSGLKRGECHLTTVEGSKIPLLVIFS